MSYTITKYTSNEGTIDLVAVFEPNIEMVIIPPFLSPLPFFVKYIVDRIYGFISNISHN